MQDWQRMKKAQRQGMLLAMVLCHLIIVKRCGYNMYIECSEFKDGHRAGTAVSYFVLIFRLLIVCWQSELALIESFIVPNFYP